MFSRILRQPSQLEIAFQYLWKDLLLIPKQSQKLLIKEEEKTLPKAQNHPVIDFFGEPYYSKTKDHQKLSDESQEDDETGQNQKFPQVEIQMDKEAEATRLHIDENENIQQLDENERRETRRPAYPTKNFLPFFKPSFVSYLAKHFDEEYFNSIPIIEKMNIKKNAINLKDYQELLCFEEFRPILECYFAERQIYRFLMMSRIHTKNKLVYLKKIHVLERAFQKRVFAKIN